MEINNNANNTNTTIDNHKAKMSLVLSTDAKPRLKWTCDLHHKFIEAVNQLGGPNSTYFCLFFIFIFMFLDCLFLIYLVVLFMFVEATPKGLMKVMEIPGLTLYHLKSHLQV